MTKTDKSWRIRWQSASTARQVSVVLYGVSGFILLLLLVHLGLVKLFGFSIWPETKSTSEQKHFQTVDNHIVQGEKQLELGQYDEASRLFRQALYLDPINVRARRGYDQAETERDSSLRIKTTADLIEKNSFEEAYELLNVVQSNPLIHNKIAPVFAFVKANFADTISNQARKQYQAASWNDCVNNVLQALALDPTHETSSALLLALSTFTNSRAVAKKIINDSELSRKQHLLIERYPAPGERDYVLHYSTGIFRPTTKANKKTQEIASDEFMQKLKEMANVLMQQPDNKKDMPPLTKVTNLQKALAEEEQFIPNDYPSVPRIYAKRAMANALAVLGQHAFERGNYAQAKNHWQDAQIYNKADSKSFVGLGRIETYATSYLHSLTSEHGQKIPCTQIQVILNLLPKDSLQQTKVTDYNAQCVK